VDAYAAIEQNRLKYLRLNKKNFARMFIKAFKMLSLQVIVTLLSSDRESFYHLLSQ
jgi:hypothetical protein